MGIENLLETEAKIMAIFVETKEVEAEVEVDLIQVPMRVASKTVNKDKGRCFYCNEFGHFINECSKKTEDERSRRYSRVDSDYQQEGQYSDYDDTGLFTDDYDDEVFATLNS